MRPGYAPGVAARRSLLGALAVLGAVLLLLAGCGSSGSGSQTGGAFVFLTVDGFSLGGGLPDHAVALVQSFLQDPGVSTQVCVTLRNNPKNPTVTTPTTLDHVVVESYTVSFTRADGGPPPGPFTFSVSVLVPAGTIANGVLSGNTAQFPIVLVPARAKRLPPLFPFPRLPNRATAEVFFVGRDGRGQRVETRGAVAVSFEGDGDDARAICQAAS